MTSITMRDEMEANLKQTNFTLSEKPFGGFQSYVYIPHSKFLLRSQQYETKKIVFQVDYLVAIYCAIPKMH